MGTRAPPPPRPGDAPEGPTPHNAKRANGQTMCARPFARRVLAAPVVPTEMSDPPPCAQHVKMRPRPGAMGGGLVRLATHHAGCNDSGQDNRQAHKHRSPGADFDEHVATGIPRFDYACRNPGWWLECMISRPPQARVVAWVSNLYIRGRPQTRQGVSTRAAGRIAVVQDKQSIISATNRVGSRADPMPLSWRPPT